MCKLVFMYEVIDDFLTLLLLYYNKSFPFPACVIISLCYFLFDILHCFPFLFCCYVIFVCILLIKC
jgi:hypothetical protein